MQTYNYDSPPMDENGRYDKKAIKKLYIESPHLEWTTFARSRNWNPESTRRSFPISAWKNAKRKIMAQERAEQFENLSADHALIWKNEILKTMRDYPALIDRVRAIAEVKINDVVRQMTNARSAAGVEVDTIERLANVIDKLTQAKHRSLLLNQISLKVAEEPLSPVEEARQQGETPGFIMQVMGRGKMSLPEISAEVARWYDQQPIDVSHREQAANEIEKAESQEGEEWES